MNPLYVVPSVITALLLLSVGIYLLRQKPRKRYILPLVALAFTMFLWNVGVILTNLTEGDVLWAHLSTMALIFIPPLVFQFCASYTHFFRSYTYLLAYIPFVALAFLLPTGNYVTGTDFIGYGYEPVYKFLPFTIHSWGGLILILFSMFMLIQYYRESVGIKQRQILYILFAIPTNALLSYVSFSVMVDVLGVAQFPVGAVLDAVMVLLIVYAVMQFKLPVGTGSEIDFRLLAETASEGICIVDEEGNVDYANTHFAQLVAAPAKQFLGRPFRDFVAGEHTVRFQDAVHRTMQGHKITNLDINLQRGTAVLNTELNTSPIYLEGRIIGGFVTVRDITERKQTERELARQKNYFQALFESSPEAIVSMDRQHRVTDVNPAFVRIFGYTAEELRGKNIDDFILPEDREEEGRDITSHVVSGDTIKLESVRCRRDGSRVPVSILGAPVFVEGEQVGIFGIYRDITDRKEAEEEREFYNSLLRHDVANRNMVVQGNLEIMDSLHLTPEQQSLVSNALHAVQASTHLIQKVRDLRAAEGEHRRSPVSLEQIIEGAVQANRQQAEDRSIAVTVHPCPVRVMAGPFLDSIVSNLIQNAIVHSGCSHLDISCGTATVDDREYVTLSIADDGAGIAPEVRQKLFHPGIKRRGSPGSGLGLYLVKKMVENYGGWIAVRDHMDEGTPQGTVFILYLEPAPPPPSA